MDDDTDGPASQPAGRPVSRRGIWGWMLFDWAQQPFHTLIITFVFAPYFAAAAMPRRAAPMVSSARASASPS